MINYIKGIITELSPTEVILENSGIGYNILISLQTFEALKEKKDATVYIHHHLREDDEQYYGFAGKDERELFRLLIGVSGIGVSTARMMLSSLSAEEIRNAILAEDLNKIKSIKGIGLKSAQRLILELKDKIAKGEGVEISLIGTESNTAEIEEATRALLMLGFTKPNINKVIQKIFKEEKPEKVEDIIKIALKLL
ncbi:MAG: Holliday junction branch migration protein RuvA [Candidatus Cryptobacteroides sp.]